MACTTAARLSLDVENAELRAENARLRAKLADAVDYEAYANGRRPMNRYEKLFAAAQQATVDVRQYGFNASLQQEQAVRLQSARQIDCAGQAAWVDGVLCGRTPKDDHGEGEG
jgi:hypothetical protein